jgi:drug/metabolite transporter (DMT)-like permease
MIDIIFNYIIFALSLIGTQKMALFMPLQMITPLRTLVSGILIVCVATLTNRSAFASLLNKKMIAAVLLLGFGNVFLINDFLTRALAFLPASRVTLLYNLNPFMYAIGASLITWRLPSSYRLLSFLLGFVGLIFVLGFDFNTGLTFHLADAYALGAALLAALAAYGMKFVADDLQLGGIAIIGMSMLVGGSMGAANLFPLSQLSVYLKGSALLISSATILCTAVSAMLYYFLFSRYSPQLITLASFTAPVFLTIIESLVSGMMPSLSFSAGALLIMGSLYLFACQKR